MIVLVILLAVSGIVLTAMYQMAMRQASVANRTEMHSGVRSVTEVLQQEISQAGRIAFPDPEYTALSAAVVSGACDNNGAGVSSTVAVDNPEYMFDGIRLLIDIGDCEEVVTAAFDGANITAAFRKSHALGALVRPAGAFAEGILANSTGTRLNMFGDINDDGSLVYIEYICNPNAAGGTLTRQEMPWDTPVANTGDFPAQLLLTNVLPNPDDPLTGNPVPCFTYQQQTVTIDGTPFTFTINVGVTLTAKAEFDDPQTGAQQVETKALLTVSPRNIFQAWEMATMSGTKKHVQPTPPNITELAE
ncbi:MAG: hypothetical protein HY316_06745 [Acidobacteria bacterium]|nr:hypothetical protein [Acidobacteriota bacterium]